MKIIIEGKIEEKDLIFFARFLREMWRNREDKLFVFIEKGMENLPSEKCTEVFKQIFAEEGDKDWKSKPMTKKMEKEFGEFLERIK